MEGKDNSPKWSLKPLLFARRIVVSPWNFARGPHFGLGLALLAWDCLTNFLAQKP